MHGKDATARCDAMCALHIVHSVLHRTRQMTQLFQFGAASVFGLRRPSQAQMLFPAPAIPVTGAPTAPCSLFSIRSIAMKRLFDSLSRWVQGLAGHKLGYIYTY